MAKNKKAPAADQPTKGGTFADGIAAAVGERVLRESKNCREQFNNLRDRLANHEHELVRHGKLIDLLTARVAELESRRPGTLTPKPVRPWLRFDGMVPLYETARESRARLASMTQGLAMIGQYQMVQDLAQVLLLLDNAIKQTEIKPESVHAEEKEGVQRRAQGQDLGGKEGKEAGLHR